MFSFCVPYLWASIDRWSYFKDSRRVIAAITALLPMIEENLQNGSVRNNWAIRKDLNTILSSESVCHCGKWWDRHVPTSCRRSSCSTTAAAIIGGVPERDMRSETCSKKNSCQLLITVIGRIMHACHLPQFHYSGSPRDLCILEVLSLFCLMEKTSFGRAPGLNTFFPASAATEKSKFAHRTFV